MSKTSLTAQEKDVLRLAIGGKVNKEIAQALDMQYQSVRNALSRAYKKIGISSTRQLIPIAEQVLAQLGD